MKKLGLSGMIIFLIFVLILVGCCTNNGEDNGVVTPPNGEEEENGDEDESDENAGENAENAGENAEEALSSYDFYPFLQNVRLHYDGAGSEYVEEKIHFDYVYENRAQIRRQTGGTTLLEVIHHDDGKVYSVFQKGESYRRESFYNLDLLEVEDAEILIMDPIEIGTQWEVREGVLREITNVGMILATPAGEFEVIEVTTYEEDSTFTVYYGKDYGKVKTLFEADETEIYTELVDVDEDYQVVEEVTFFYPEFNEDRLVYFEEAIPLATNVEIEDIFEQYFRRSPREDSDEYVGLMSENTSINFIRLNREDFVGHIDFSEEFVTEMNAGTTLESMILSSVVRTVGEYFRVGEVKLTIEGEPYTSGHFEFQEGEYLENTPGDNEQEIEKVWMD
ncbi:GerMN domain-containing protein [Isachenkonia alkalipeptolytica]|uniref:GerMN domain-containing protein n=1 Tax=Isachenkonia alkalipeptolytica TaxID=2565777 RepID=A0AA43XJH7_9CLOT|nr:GerMN domain-containing protein [Isachenkonia alkalipeptolytica]NBG87963.1 hypothetical protein [Isachenkonia alkalipeptolytica]